MLKSSKFIYASLLVLAVAMVAIRANGQNWTQRTPVTSPPTRYSNAMAYDASRQRVVLLDINLYGSSGFMYTWEWDGAWWLQRSPAMSPSIRYFHAMAYDSARQRVILFGGIGNQARLNDTWEWDGINWTQRAPLTSPPARYSHAMAYDSARQRVVLFGGSAPTGNDTWEWDGNNWTQRSAVTIPAGRAAHAMAYDSARQRVILFGGTLATAGGSSDTWEWDGNNWTQRTPTNNPPARNSHAMAYDASRQRVVLFGGEVNFRWQNDTWEWDGSNWTQRLPTTSPSIWTWYSMAYDASRQRVVLFGQNGFTAPLHDTWEYGFLATVALTGAPRVGGTINLSLLATYDPGLSYQVGSSLGTGPIPIDTRQIDLSPDNLLVISTSNLWPWIFSGYQGVIDGKGRATASINIPNIPALIGTRIHTAFVTLDPPSPSGIRSISQTNKLLISK